MLKRKLSDKSIRYATINILKRSFASTFFLIFGFLFNFSLVPSLQNTAWSTVCIGTMCLIGLIRFFVVRHASHAQPKPNQARTWRLIFRSSNWTVGCLWGLNTAMVVQGLGITTASLTVFLTTCFVSMGTVTTYSFDFFASAVFNVLMIIPASVAALLLPGSVGLFVGIAGISFAVYLIYAAFSLYRFQYEILLSNEIIEEQKGELESQKMSLIQMHTELKDMHLLMQGMLEAVDEVFLVFNGQGICVNEVSQKSRDLLGGDPSKKHIADILNVSEDRRQDLHQWYTMLVEERIPFEDLATFGESVYELPDKTKTLKLKYSPIRGPTGEVSSVVMTAVDVTDELRANNSARKARERAEMILRIQENRSGFRAFLADTEGLIERFCNWQGGDPASLLRALHTAKGTASIFGAAGLVKLIYDHELQIRGQGEGVSVKFLRDLGQSLASAFKEFQTTEVELFNKLGVFDGDLLEISTQQLAAIEKELSVSPQSREIVDRFVRALTSPEVSMVLRDFDFQIRNMGAKLGKAVDFVVEAENGPVSIPPSAFREVFSTFVHLFNNALDHGIETREERLAAGKKERGQIKISYSRVNTANASALRLVIQDDGRGIDVANIRASLKRKGFVGIDDKSDNEIAASILNAGVSSRDIVTEVSGQGIGMGAVREAVVKAGGSIKILKTDRDGTTFEIILPEARLQNQAA